MTTAERKMLLDAWSALESSLEWATESTRDPHCPLAEQIRPVIRRLQREYEQEAQ